MKKVKNMNIIGVTKKIGLEKTTLIKEFEKENAIILDIDEMSRDFYQNYNIIEETICYLEEKYHKNIADLNCFFETLMTARKEIEQLDDPIYKAIETKIDEIINRNSTKDIILVLQWNLLPKTKYFNLSNYNILLLPNDDIGRKGTKKKNEKLEESTHKTSKKDTCYIDYEKYKYDTIAIDLPDNAQISLLKDFILKELNKEKE